jgi:acetyl-CoA acetyltransferase
MTLRNKAAIVGVGRSEYYKRGGSEPQTITELAGKAILAAVEDAGLSITDVDGFANYSSGGGVEPDLVAQILGIPELTYTATLTGGGGGSAAAVGLAAGAILTGQANVVVSVLGLQQTSTRFGKIMVAADVRGDETGGQGGYGVASTPEKDFIASSGLVGPGQFFALLAKRHMHQYGTTREHFAEVAISTRQNALNRPTARMRTPLTKEEYFAARLISEPLCLYDFCLETDGAVAVVTTSAERARDLKQAPAYIRGVAHGGAGRWGQAIAWMGMPEEYFASSGHRPIAKRLYEMAGVSPSEIDVALLYDHFTPMVLMQLEDYGLCPVGESGPFVAGGNIRFGTGSIPVNTHGGNLSEAYIIGMTHVMEGVEQIRGTAVNQVDGAELALVTGGPASIPVSGLILGASAEL